MKNALYIEFVGDNCQYLQPIAPRGFTFFCMGAASNEADAYQDALQCAWSSEIWEEIKHLFPKRKGNKRRNMSYYFGPIARGHEYSEDLYVYCLIFLPDHR